MNDIAIRTHKWAHSFWGLDSTPKVAQYSSIWCQIPFTSYLQNPCSFHSTVGFIETQTLKTGKRKE